MSGYVRIHRTLLGHPAFRNESETMAFAWLIAKAAWKPTRVRYKGHSINLGRGQLAISQRDMAAAFDRDKAWIERLWRRLKSEAMIEASVEAGVAVITICNYSDYQADKESGEAAGEAPGEAGNEAAVRQRRGTEQEREKDKKKILERKSALPDGWVPAQFGDGSQSKAIVDGWPAKILAVQVEKFAAHHTTRGNKFVDWQSAWKTWVLNSEGFAQTPQQSTAASEPANFLEYKIAERKRIEAFEARR